MAMNERRGGMSMVVAAWLLLGCSGGAGSAPGGDGAAGTGGPGGSGGAGTTGAAGTTGGAGTTGAAGTTGGAGAVATEADFIANFDDIACKAVAMACAISNDAGVDLYDCLFKRADFGNKGKMGGISADLRMSLTNPGSTTEFCPHVDKPSIPGGFTCKSWADLTFGGGCVILSPGDTPCSWEGNIWLHSDPKPSSPEKLLETCNIH
jgi:hypothetical protein